MILKGIYKNKSLSFYITLIMLLMLFSLCVTYIITSFIIDYSTIILVDNMYNSESLLKLKLIQVLNGIGLFIIPSIIYLYMTGLEVSMIKTNRQAVLLVLVIILCLNPIITVLYQFNQLLPLSDWLLEYEKKAKLLTDALLNMYSTRDLIVNILSLALIPAVAEELFFRAILQKTIVNHTRSIHIGVIITSIIFSAVHMQFHGFLPRLLLGGLLGYLFVFSRSLTLPIIAHFFNNTMVILFSYPAFVKYIYFNQERVQFSEFLIALLLVCLLSYLLYKNLQNYSRP
tara:strand:- start:1077 stop:1934 length:858 start_codon:yes stop_codon:yes gene_type:complete